ncbi:transient receptor potential cation channel subfamily M member 2 [Caerostris extrusa]|uniref:Transient receptor potential cation channel subfamily M member 2 n=1 Tax=Caerostris extrusa TaxID=172846 RepID=A0AAV4V7P9_CAEEX|nr:transient receptor potential cation channel subfamily M member 2 [Caerostris extrusa]
MKNNREGEEEDKTEERMQKILTLVDAFHRQKESIRHLESMLMKLHIRVKNDHKYLANSMLQVSLKEEFLPKMCHKYFSRISPYPFTNISRFPVSDNHVTWERAWKSYDPIAANMPKEDFFPELRPFVDVDIQMMREMEGEEFQMPVFKWNKSSLSPGGMLLNRKSWITGKFGKEFQYDLDAESLPVNPFGRTGLRGRGALPRWGLITMHL